MTFEQKMTLTTLVFDAMCEETVAGMRLERAKCDSVLRDLIMDSSAKAKLKLRDDIVALMGVVDDRQTADRPDQRGVK